jgi:hypothetical protein
MTALVPAALTEADLPLAELACARLDGELFPLAGSWCPIDFLDAPETRARAIAPVAPHRGIAERLTAAWIFGLAPEPAEHQFCIDVAARTHKSPCGSVHLREVRLAAEDTVLVGRLRVTAPLRTAIDLARWGVAHGRPADPKLVAALLVQAGVSDDLADGNPLPAGRRGVSFTRIAEQALRDAVSLLGRPSRR